MNSLGRAGHTLGRTFVVLAVVGMVLIVIQPPASSVPLGSTFGVLLLGSAFGMLLAGSYVYFLSRATDNSDARGSQDVDADEGESSGSTEATSDIQATTEAQPSPPEASADAEPADPVAPRRLNPDRTGDHISAETRLKAAEATQQDTTDSDALDDGHGADISSAHRTDEFEWND